MEHTHTQAHSNMPNRSNEYNIEGPKYERRNKTKNQPTNRTYKNIAPKNLFQYISVSIRCVSKKKNKQERVN